MKKYLLKLIDEDIKSIKKLIQTYEKTVLDERFKEDIYFIRRLSGQKKKLEQVEKYKLRVEKL